MTILEFNKPFYKNMQIELSTIRFHEFNFNATWVGIRRVRPHVSILFLLPIEEIEGPYIFLNKNKYMYM